MPAELVREGSVASGGGALPRVVCESRIVSVEVYARGAVVTRRVTVPETLPPGPVDVVIPGVTPAAEPGSIRAAIAGDREIVATQAPLVIPEAPAGPGDAIQRIRKLELEAFRLANERRSVEARRETVAASSVTSSLPDAQHKGDPAERARDALAAHGILALAIADLDRRLEELDLAIARNEKAFEAARVDAAQAKSSERMGAGHPTREVVLRLAGEGGARSIDVTYTVAAARWWPTYTVRLSDALSKAELTLGARVAQLSGEDWGGVRLSLTTADLTHDARLPELPSLRLGRAQPKPKRGYRPPPPGLDEMFAGYDAALASLPSPQSTTVVRRERPAPKKARRPAPEGGATGAVAAAAPARQRGRARSEETQRELAALDDGVLAEEAAALPPPPSLPAGPPSAAPLAPGALPRMAMQATMIAPAAAAPRRGGLLAGLSFGGGGGAPADVEDVRAFAQAEPAAIEPADAWLDFDSLAIAPSQERARRGRLVRDLRGPAAPAAGSVEGVALPRHAVDPLRARGLFDHRYDAESLADVPSDGRPHLVLVARAAGSPRARFVTVPREAAEVYREVELENPFDAPLLGGPVDVFVDGALLLTSGIEPIDRGGSIPLGLGLEDRIRVARNARTDEGSAGLLGGSTTVDHDVTIDLRSSLGRPATVFVLERVPVTDEEDVEITHSAKPAPERYDQSDRGSPIRGGLRWRIELAAGGTATIQLGYRVKLPAKQEIVGGNRRE
jgi:hypothetical protein